MEQQARFKVLVNQEGQYSLWPEQKASPAGWTETDQTGSEEDCMAYVDRVWTDMRPRSLREHGTSNPER